MNIDDRPTDRPQGPFTHFGKFQMAITLQRVIRTTSCLVLGWGFRGRRIERAISGSFKSKMAAGGHFENFKWPIFLQRIIRFTLCMYTNHVFCPWMLQRLLTHMRLDTYLAREGN